MPPAEQGTPLTTGSVGRPGRMERVLIIEDDPTMLDILTMSLGARGYAVTGVPTGKAAMEHLAEGTPAVVILDLGLPDIDGIELCRRMRGMSRASIIVVTADGSEDRQISALDHGADDYVTKPFSMPELLARLRVALRHSRVTHPVVDDTEILMGGLRMNHALHTASLDGGPLVLTPKEYALLALLASHPGKIITHRILLEQVWGIASAERTEYLRTYTNQLRKKLGVGPTTPRLVTVPAVGYRLVSPDDND
jgi:two-component system KDP operon response regulator KdpE